MPDAEKRNRNGERGVGEERIPILERVFGRVSEPIVMIPKLKN